MKDQMDLKNIIYIQGEGSPPAYYMNPVQLIAVNKHSPNPRGFLSLCYWRLCGRVLGILLQILTASDPWAGREEGCGEMEEESGYGV